MIESIINKYENFSDSLISKIEYKTIENSRFVEVTINCMNRLKDYEFETIKLLFEDVFSFRFIESENSLSTLINSALIKYSNEIIVFDFFPLIIGDNELSENKHSDFQIKSRRVCYLEVPS